MNHHLNEFCRTTRELLASEQVRSMGRWNHHGRITTLDHSLFVAYLSYRAARALGLDAQAAARGGLLHDLYLYDGHDRTAYPGNHCFYHPAAALNNARELVEMSEKEENIIVSHMWPRAKTMPRSREALIVNVADKFCAVLEVSYLARIKRIRRWVPDAARFLPVSHPA